MDKTQPGQEGIILEKLFYTEHTLSSNTPAN